MRAQVGAWTLVYSRRMDSQYMGTVMVAEVAVQFSSFRAGWTSWLSSSWVAAGAARHSLSVGLTTGARATATTPAASSSRPRFIGVRLRDTSGAMKVGKITQRISGPRRRGNARKVGR